MEELGALPLGNGDSLTIVRLGARLIAHCIQQVTRHAVQEFGFANPAASPPARSRLTDPRDSYTDDHLGLMDHLGIREFLVMGFCVGGLFVWNLLRRAPNRVVAAVLAQPSGFRPEIPDLFYQNNITGWGPPLCERQPGITMAMVDAFLTRMYRANAEFVLIVTRDFVRDCRTPILVLPDDVPAHPYAVAIESARLAPNSQVSLYPWKEPADLIPLAVRHVRTFLRAHRPVPFGH